MEFESIDVSPIFRKSWVCLGEYPEIYTTIYHLYFLGLYNDCIRAIWEHPQGSLPSTRPPAASEPTSVTLGTSTLNPCMTAACSRAFARAPWGTSKTDNTPRTRAKVKRMQRRHITSRHATRKKCTRSQASKAHLFPAGKSGKDASCVCTHRRKKNGHTNANVFKTRWKLLNESAEGSTTLETELETQKNNDFQAGVYPFPNHLFLVLMLKFPGCTFSGACPFWTAGISAIFLSSLPNLSE